MARIKLEQNERRTPVQVTIVGRHMEIPEQTKAYIERKLEKLPRFYDRVMQIEVVIDGQSPGNTVEIVVSVAKHREFVVQETGEDVLACFDVCVDKMERQLRRHKEKVRNRKHPEQPQAEAEKA
jgi:putative sigma-54 modulation protein